MKLFYKACVYCNILQSSLLHLDSKTRGDSSSSLLMQVHAARLKESQKDVVIKVLKPDVEDTLTVDLNFIYITAKVLEFLNPQLSRTSLVCNNLFSSL